MSFGRPKSNGPNFVPAYQVSGVPFVTSSQNDEVTTTPVKITFPGATRFFVFTNTGVDTLRVGFSENGVNGIACYNDPGNTREHYFLVTGSHSHQSNASNGTSSTVRLELRCKELFIRLHDNIKPAANKGQFSLVAGMSGVDATQFPVLTGTMIFTGSDGNPLPGGGIPAFKGIG